jgi:hypothetical protein
VGKLLLGKFQMMKRQIILILVILLTFVGISGCKKAQQMSVAGKYVLVEGKGSFFELNDDGTFYMEEWGQVLNRKTEAVTGEYTLEGDQITLTKADGNAIRATVADGVLTDDKDKKWLKE